MFYLSGTLVPNGQRERGMREKTLAMPPKYFFGFSSSTLYRFTDSFRWGNNGMGHQSGAGGNVSRPKQRTNSLMPIAEAVGRGHRSLGHCGRKGRDVSWVGHWTEQSRFWIVDTLSRLGCKRSRLDQMGRAQNPAWCDIQADCVIQITVAKVTLPAGAVLCRTAHFPSVATPGVLRPGGRVWSQSESRHGTGHATYSCVFCPWPPKWGGVKVTGCFCSS